MSDAECVPNVLQNRTPDPSAYIFLPNRSGQKGQNSAVLDRTSLCRHMPCALSLSRLSQAQRDRSHQVVLRLRGALGLWPTLVSTTIFETKLLIFRIHYYHSAMAKTRNSTSTAAASSAFLLKAAPGGKKRVVVPRPKTYDVSSIGRAVLELGFYN